MSDFSKPVLAFDSALGGCVVAVLDSLGGKVVSKVLATEREQALRLVPMIQEAMQEAGFSFENLGLIVTTVGPGSFTGLRISLSTTRAMGLSLGIPVQGVSTFDAMIRSCAPGRPSLVVLESKRADFYVQEFDADGKKVDEAVCLSSLFIGERAIGKTVCGDAIMRLRKETSDVAFPEVIERVLLDPAVLAEIGLEIFLETGRNSAKPYPVYMREPDVSISGKIQRQIQQ